MTHIELIGIDGSGKTTLLQGVQNDPNTKISNSNKMIDPTILSKFDNSVIRRVQNKLWNIYFRKKYFKIYTKNRPKSVTEIDNIFQTTFDHPTNFESLLKNAAAQYELSRKKHHNRISIFDEGLLQFVPLISFVDSDLGKDYLLTLPNPDLVVLTKCPPTVCYDRQSKRSKGHSSYLEPYKKDDAIQILNELQNNFESVINYCDETGINIAKIDTNELNKNESKNQFKKIIDQHSNYD